AGDAKFNIRIRRRSVTSQLDHLVRDVDADHMAVRRALSYQARRPSRSATNVKHVRGPLNFHQLDGLFADRTMALFHALALAGPGPIVKLQTQALVHLMSDKLQFVDPPWYLNRLLLYRQARRST